MTKVKLTLSIEKVLLNVAREKKINLSKFLEYALIYNLKLKKVISIVEEKEYY